MKAALLREIGRPLSVEEVPTPNLGPGEALVRVHTCGICRTDLHIQDGLAYVPKLPHIPGHEPAGTIAALGAGVTNLQVGQRVAPHLFVASADCRFTRTGQQAQATHLSGIIGVTMPGGFAEYVTIPSRNLLVLPDEVPFDAGGLTSCAVITTVHAYRKAQLQAGDTAVVLGAGGIGLMLVQLLTSAGIRTVAVSRSPISLDLARQAGAELALSLEDPTLAEQIRGFSGSDKSGADCVFELVGLANTMQIAAASAMRGGKIVVIGEEAEFPAIDTIQIAQRELQILGSRNGSFQDARDALEFMASGVIRPTIAARFPLSRINEALDEVRTGRAHGRVIIDIPEPTSP